KRGTIQVRISKSKNWRYEALVLIHELTEMFLCIDRGVSFKAIDRFDMRFEGKGEPGNDPKAPYYSQHRFATRVERLLAKELQVNWRAYRRGAAQAGSERRHTQRPRSEARTLDGRARHEGEWLLMLRIQWQPIR